jgi:hypothetical protein
MKLSHLNTESLEKKFSNRKSIPEEYKDVIILALSHYPELMETEVFFDIVPGSGHFAKTALTSVNILSSARKRKYHVKIFKSSTKDLHSFESLSAEEQIGAIGRELALITICNGIGLKGFVKNVLFQLHRRLNLPVEFEIDRSVVRHGLASQLLAYSKKIGTLPGLESVHVPSLTSKEMVSLQNQQLGL